MRAFINGFEIGNPAKRVQLNEQVEGLDLPGIRTSKGVRAGQHGGYFGAQFFDMRAITLNGTVVQDVDQSQIEEIKNKPLCGFISLQNHGKPIEWRDLRLPQVATGSSPVWHHNVVRTATDAASVDGDAAHRELLQLEVERRQVRTGSGQDRGGAGTQRYAFEPDRKVAGKIPHLSPPAAQTRRAHPRRRH